MQSESSFLPTLQPLTTRSMKSLSLRIKKLSQSKSTVSKYKGTAQTTLISTLSQSRIGNSQYYNYYEPEADEDPGAEIKEIQSLLNKSKEEFYTDKQDKHIIGTEAIRKYYKHLRILDRIEEENELKQINASLYTSMQKTASLQGILPCKIGLLKYEGDRDLIKINNMKYGDKYMDVLQEGIKKVQGIENFQLANNRITSSISGRLIQSLSKNAKEVNLCKNRIGGIGIDNITSSLINKDCRIEVLDLEDNQLGNKLISLLCQSLVTNKTIVKLNLSKNFITNFSCNAIASMLLDNTNLKELYLFWNQIKGEGGKMIFDSLLTNTYLKVLDLSQNTLGQSSSCAQSFSDLVQQNNELMHVDLSFNQFNLKDTQIIAEGLVKNRTIYGFHFTGNKGYVDTKGFLIPIEQIQEDQGQSLIAQRIKSCQYIAQQRIRQSRDTLLKDCCWICEGWRQQELKWVNGVSGDWNEDPTFIHLNYLDFCGLYFGKQTNSFKLLRMIPPGQTRYFFTIGEQQTIAKSQPIINQQTYLHHVDVAGQEQTIVLESINELNIVPDNYIIDQYFEPVIQVLPRTKDPIYIPPKKKKQRIIWTFPISLFKDWKKDHEEILNQCFETDWGGSRIQKMIKTEEDAEKCKAFLKSIYPFMKDTYKNYSCFNPVGDVWAIQMSIYQQILQATKFIEGKEKESNNTPLARQPVDTPKIRNTFEDLQSQSVEDLETAKLQRMTKATIKPQDLDLKFISTISGTEKGNPRKPDRGMIRFQFMEVWVRIAEEKYSKTGVAQNMADSLKYIWEDHLKQEFMQYSTQIWRDQRYWNEQCDYCLKFYRQLVDHIYFKNSVKKVKPGQKPFMCLQELIDLTSQAGLNQFEHFGSQVPFVAYCKAMMTQVDELKTDRIFQMSFVEFIEAFSRIADEASLQPHVGAFPEGTEWNLQKLKDLPLHYKIESLLLQCLENCADASFKANFRKPEKSFFTPVPDSDDEH